MMKLFNMDAYKWIESSTEKVNHIITDPPYNISKENNFTTMNTVRQGIDFGEWDKNFDLFSWIPLYTKILDKNGSMVIFCSYLYLSHIIDVLNNSGMIVKDVIIWQKTNPMPRNINRRYVSDTEFAVWAVKKGAKWVFNKQEDVKYQRTIFQYPLVAGKEKWGHPTQKSLKLMKDIVSIHTNADDVILDPFMGSGTTGVAALELGRSFIGIELSEEYFNMAQNRLKVLT